MKYEVKVVRPYRPMMYYCPHCNEDQEVDINEFHLDDGQWISNPICDNCDKESIVLGGVE